MTQATLHLGWRYACPHGMFMGGCERGAIKPRRTKCRRCGSALHVERGVWATFSWREHGRYPLEAAHSVHASRSIAEQRAIALGRVARFVALEPELDGATVTIKGND